MTGGWVTPFVFTQRVRSELMNLCNNNTQFIASAERTVERYRSVKVAATSDEPGSRRIAKIQKLATKLSGALALLSDIDVAAVSDGFLQSRTYVNPPFGTNNVSELKQQLQELAAAAAVTVRQIDTRRGAGERGAEQSLIAHLAKSYRNHLGRKPARYRGGHFDRVAVLVLREAGYKYARTTAAALIGKVLR